MLKITPPETSSEKRVKNFTFIDAISKLPTHFTSSEIRPILTRAKIHFSGKIRATFVVISDDAPSQDQATDTEAEPDDDAPEPDGAVVDRAQNSRKRVNPESAHVRPGIQRARR